MSLLDRWLEPEQPRVQPTHVDDGSRAVSLKPPTPRGAPPEPPHLRETTRVGETRTPAPASAAHM